MNLDTLLSLFETYGWPGIVAVLIIAGFVYFVNKKDDSTNKTINEGFSSLSKSITEQNETLINVIKESNEKTQERLFDIIGKGLNAKEADNKDEHDQSIKQRLEISEEIGDILWDLMNIYNAQRTMVIEFHNSKENLNGLSFVWYDVQYEKQQRDIACISPVARNLQASNLLPVINRVNSTPGNIVYYSSEDIENIYEQSTVLYSQLKELNASNIIYCGLYNEYNKMIGLVVLEYTNGHAFHEDLINYYDIKAKSAVISKLLQFKHKTNNIDK